MPRTTQQYADELLAENLAVGKTVVAAARAAGVSERTAYRRMKEPTVRARIAEVRRTALDAVAGRLTHGMASACDHLTELIGHDNPHVQIRAAKTVLQLALQVRREVDIEDRLDQLGEPPRLPLVGPALAGVSPRPVALGPSEGPVERSDQPEQDGNVASPTGGERNVCVESDGRGPVTPPARSPAPDSSGRTIRDVSHDPGMGAPRSGRSVPQGMVVLGLLLAAGLSFAATGTARTHPEPETDTRVQTCHNLPEPATRLTFAPVPVGARAAGGEPSAAGANRAGGGGILPPEGRSKDGRQGALPDNRPVTAIGRHAGVRSRKAGNKMPPGWARSQPRGDLLPPHADRNAGGALGSAVPVVRGTFRPRHLLARTQTSPNERDARPSREPGGKPCYSAFSFDSLTLPFIRGSKKDLSADPTLAGRPSARFSAPDLSGTPMAAPTSSHAGVSRRQVIRAGLFGLAGLSLPDLLRLRAAGDPATRDTAVIYVLQEGGASQFETWDPKPDAGSEIRGEFGTIQTTVPGVRFSEGMTEQARIMDRLVVLRSVHHPSTQHSSSVHLIKTGYYCQPASNENEMPSVGAYAARVRGPVAPKVPPYVVLNTGERYDGAHFLGSGYAPFAVTNNPDRPELKVPNLTLLGGVTGEQLRDRVGLLDTFERDRRVLDGKGQAAAMDEFQRQAAELVTGPAARAAFDLAAEAPALRDRYGRGYLGDRFLLARRLVEHGVRFVTVGSFDWDHHGSLWKSLRRDGPGFDRALSALVTDLADRGLAENVLVVVTGEFGRTPKISSLGSSPPGRDHWGDVMSVLLAGGGFDGGRVIGSSDAKGGVPTSSPYRLECVLAVMYRHLGIDPGTTFPDHTGRPRSLLEIRDRIKELEG